MPEGELMQKFLEWFASLLHSIFGKKYKVDVEEIPDQPQQPPDPIPTPTQPPTDPQPSIKPPVITALSLIEDGTKIRVDYESETPVDVVSSNGTRTQPGTDQDTPLDIPIDSGLAAPFDKIDGKIVGAVIITLSNAGGSDTKRLDIPRPKPEPPQQPSAPVQPPQAPDLNRGFLNALKTGNKKTTVVVNAPNGKKYGAAQPSQDFGFSPKLTKVADQGGYIYDANTGNLIESSFNGAYPNRQWLDDDTILGYLNSVVNIKKLGQPAKKLFDLDDVREAYPDLDIVSFYCGPREGKMFNQCVYITAKAKNNRVYVIGYWVEKKRFQFCYESKEFDWSKGEPDFASTAFINPFLYFYKAVSQGASNTSTPWLIYKSGNAIRSQNKNLYHATAAVFEREGRDIDVIVTIGGEITSLEDGAYLGKHTGIASKQSGALSEHIGALGGQGQKFVVHDDKNGRIFISRLVGGGTIQVVEDAAEANIAADGLDYVTAAANGKKTMVFYLRNDGKRIIETL